ncbi:MAG: YceI family protein [Bacteroidales bacterium]|nr:YceI family protein [Bacteroidales bacterium]
MKTIIFAAILILSTSFASAKQYITKTGQVKFYSHTPIEDIEAINRQAVGILDTESGSMQFKLLIRSFEFEKALMQEHFNENFMESDQYPKSSFEGSIMNPEEIDFEVPGTYVADVSGNLTIHGVTKAIRVKGSITVTKDELITKSTFKVNPTDYNISIPEVTRKKIANEIEVTVDATYTR